MTFDVLTSNLKLIDDKVKFIGTVKDNPAVTIDYIPPIGSGEGYTSLELFLLSLSSCLGSALLLLLRKMGKTIGSLEINAEGVRREEHPTYFKTILLKVDISGEGLDDHSLQQAIKISEDTICPVLGMIKNSVDVTIEYQINGGIS